MAHVMVAPTLQKLLFMLQLTHLKPPMFSPFLAARDSENDLLLYFALRKKKTRASNTRKVVLLPLSFRRTPRGGHPLSAFVTHMPPIARPARKIGLVIYRAHRAAPHRAADEWCVVGSTAKERSFPSASAHRPLADGG